MFCSVALFCLHSLCVLVLCVGLNVAEVSSNPQLQLQSQLVVEQDALASWDSLNQVGL